MNRNKLKIVHVSQGLDVGGQEKLLVEFARHADRARFELHFVSLSGRGRIANELENLGWSISTLDAPHGLKPKMIWRLSRLFRELAADVVHTHDDRPLLYGSVARKLARVRRLIHTHHHGPLPQITQRQNSLVRMAGRLTDAFVCVSRSAATFIEEGDRDKPLTPCPTSLSREERGAKRKASNHKLPIQVLHNGIDLERFPFRGANPTGPLLTVARLSPEKDIPNLLHAVAFAKTSLPQLRVKIAGSGVCADDCHRLARELGIEERVSFLGDVGDVRTLLSQASVFVLPSRTEGISLTILEAMASGLPVIASNVGGNPEVVVDGETGVLVPAQNPLALADAIKTLVNDSHAAHDMGVAGRKRVEDHFDIREMVSHYEGLYQKASALARPANLLLLTPDS